MTVNQQGAAKRSSSTSLLIVIAKTLQDEDELTASLSTEAAASRALTQSSEDVTDRQRVQCWGQGVIIISDRHTHPLPSLALTSPFRSTGTAHHIL